MAESQTEITPTLAEQYALKEKEEKLSKPLEVKETEQSETPAPVEVISKTDEKPVEADTAQSSDNNPADEIKEDPSVADADEDVLINPPAENDSGSADQESSTNGEVEDSGDQEPNEEAPEIKLETAPVDFRFPTTNQTRHCFTRYIEFHRCTAAKGEGAPECDKFAKYYRALCPGEWVDKWNEQRENGTFPGPL